MILKEPRLKGIPIGTAQFFQVQSQLIKERALLRYNYDCWYDCLEADYLSTAQVSGAIVELGSGGSYLKDRLPSLITSDVSAGIADQVIDAQNMPFADQSLKAIFLTHCFHHIPDVERFLSEAQRTLVPNGIISMIDVANTPLCYLLMKLLHPEPFLPNRKEWYFSQSDSMLDANQALAWIVFVRDRELFHARFPNLKLELVEDLPWLTYLFSGGVTRKNLLPRFLESILIKMESRLKFLRPWCGLSWHIRIRKVNA